MEFFSKKCHILIIRSRVSCNNSHCHYCFKHDAAPDLGDKCNASKNTILHSITYSILLMYVCGTKMSVII